MLNIRFEDIYLILLCLDNHRHKCHLARLELRELGVAIPRLERGEVFIVACACPICIGEIALVVLRKGKLGNLVFELEVVLEVGHKAICHALIVGTELHAITSRKVDAQGVVVVFYGATEVKLRRNFAIYACAFNLFYDRLLAKICTLINLQTNLRGCQNLLAVALYAISQLRLGGNRNLQFAIWREEFILLCSECLHAEEERREQENNSFHIVSFRLLLCGSFWREALRLQSDCAAVGRYESCARTLGSDVTDNIDTAQIYNLLTQFERYGEEQLVVLATIQSGNHRVDIHLLGQCGGLLCQRHTLQVDACATLRRLANLQHLRSQTVGNINHRGWHNALLAQRLDHIVASTRFEITLQQILITLEFRGYGIAQALQYSALTLQQAQAHIRSTEIAGKADQIVLLCATAIGYFALLGTTYGGDVDDKACNRSRGVATNQIDACLFASELHALVEVVEELNRELRRDAEREGYLLGYGIHRHHIADTLGHNLVAEVLRREVCQVEIDTLQHRIGRYDHSLILRRLDYRSVVTNATNCRFVLILKFCCEVVNQTKLTKLCYLGSSLHIFSH